MKVTASRDAEATREGAAGGVLLRPEPRLPGELPRRQNVAYTRLAQEGRFWEAIKNEGNIKIQDSGHTAREELELELWAVRR